MSIIMFKCSSFLKYLLDEYYHTAVKNGPQGGIIKVTIMFVLCLIKYNAIKR